MSDRVVAGATDLAGADRLKAQVHRQLLALPSAPVERGALASTVADLLREEAPLLSRDLHGVLVADLVREVTGFGPLEPLLTDPAVSEVMLNGPGRAFVERGGRLEEVDLALDGPAIERLAQRVVAPLGLRLDRASPMVDARLPDGSRLHAVLPPLAPDGPCVTIRRFRARRVTLADFGLGDAPVELLSRVVRARWNLVVAGATSAGKTTLLDALSTLVDRDERVVTIEETAELHLAGPHVVRLEARPPNAEGVGGVDVRALVRAALRMRPDRIFVGEVRGGEALDMLQALNTGHDGSLSTVHASSARDALARLETLVLLAGVGLPLPAVRAQLAAAVDAVVFVARGSDGSRRVEVVAEVVEPAVVDAPLAVRPLLARGHDGLSVVGAPGRRARRLERRC